MRAVTSAAVPFIFIFNLPSLWFHGLLMLFTTSQASEIHIWMREQCTMWVWLWKKKKKRKERVPWPSVGWHRISCGIIICEGRSVRGKTDLWSCLILNLEIVISTRVWEEALTRATRVWAALVLSTKPKSSRDRDLYVCIHTVGIEAAWQGLVRASVLSVMSAHSRTLSSLPVFN